MFKPYFQTFSDQEAMNNGFTCFTCLHILLTYFPLKIIFVPAVEMITCFIIDINSYYFVFPRNFLQTGDRSGLL